MEGDRRVEAFTARLFRPARTGATGTPRARVGAGVPDNLANHP
jgi:hypothetical protein